MSNYSVIEDPCFVCEAENSLNQSRGTQSHPINCGWKLKKEHGLMQKELENDGKFLFWSMTDNDPKIVLSAFTVVNHVKEHREAINMSQENLARAVSCSRETIRTIENGKTVPNVLLALKIGKVLNASVEHLFGNADR